MGQSLMFAVALFLLVWAPAAGSRAAEAGHLISEPGSPFGVSWGSRWGDSTESAEQPAAFLAELRGIKAGAAKINVRWNDIEPEKGRYEWQALDAFVSQLRAPEEGMIGFWSCSQWATRRKASTSPASPPTNPDEYYKVVKEMVSRYRGKIRYWQNDCEPNHAKWWDGTASEFAAATKVFYRAVKDADPRAIVVLGAHSGAFNPPPERNTNAQAIEGLKFFDTVISNARDSFDAFDVHLYRDVYDIPGRIEYWRGRLTALGAKRMIFCSGFNGPSLFSFPDNAHFASKLKHAANDGGALERDAYEQAYADVRSQPPATQMFMMGCPPDMDEKFRRLQSRDTVIRCVLMLSAGVQKSYFTFFKSSWRPGMKNIGALMYAKMALVDYEQDKIVRRHPLMRAYRELGDRLGDVESLRRIAVRESKSIYFFEAKRRGRKPVHVVWDRRDDQFGADDKPSVKFTCQWKPITANAFDILGNRVPVTVKSGTLTLQVGADPIYIEP